MNTQYPTGTVTFLFTDIADSTRLAQEYPESIQELLARHDAILQKSVETCKGIIFKRVGDAICAVFFTAYDALEAALSAQREIQGGNWGPAFLKVRMGLHTGDALPTISGDSVVDYTGYLTLALTQRIVSTAYGGQVLLSGTCAGLVAGRIPKGATLSDMGEHLLKNITQPERLWQLVAGDLQADFPPLQTLSTHPNNLPAQVSSFVGRQRELAQAHELLDGARLLTLIGPGGTGKTRLALKLASELFAVFPDGVWLVELAPLADPGLIMQTVASALSVRSVPGASLEELVIKTLSGKQVLILLDNCEHLVEASAFLADQLLKACPGLKILASSREALGVPGEAIFRVPPLGLPRSEKPDLASLQQAEAIQLFVDRAVSAKPGFKLTAQNAGAVAQICLRLDGIPLAIELAAARLGMLTAEGIAARLDDRFRLLTGGSRTALPRQQTLRSLIEWSYDLLSRSEQVLFCQLSVFVGGWSLEAAETVCPDSDVLELLSNLVQKSLVAAEERDDQAETRFRMLETIRQYARDKLLETNTAAQVRNRHLDYYLKFAEAGENNFYGPGRFEWSNRCEVEHDNFRAALQWGLEYNINAALRLGGALPTFWVARGYPEGRRWLQAALDRAATLPELEGEAGRQRRSALAKALIGAGQLSYGDGDYGSGLEASQKAVQLYRDLGDWFGLGFALGTLGNMAAFQGDLELAERLLTEAIRVGQEHDLKVVLSAATGIMSQNIYLAKGDIEQARALAEESKRYSREIDLAWAVMMAEMVLARIDTLLGQYELARARALPVLSFSQELNDFSLLSQAYFRLGDIELYAGNMMEAQVYHRQAIQIFQTQGQAAFIVHEVESFAYLARAQDQPQRSARLLGAAESLMKGTGTSAFGVERLEDQYQLTIAWLQGQLDKMVYAATWAEGSAMNIHQAAAYALEKLF